MCSVFTWQWTSHRPIFCFQHSTPILSFYIWCLMKECSQGSVRNVESFPPISRCEQIKSNLSLWPVPARSDQFPQVAFVGCDWLSDMWPSEFVSSSRNHCVWSGKVKLNPQCFFLPKLEFFILIENAGSSLSVTRKYLHVEPYLMIWCV